MDIYNKKGIKLTIFVTVVLCFVQMILIILWNFNYIKNGITIFILLNIVIILLSIIIIFINKSYKIVNKEKLHFRWILFTGIIALILFQLNQWEVLDKICLFAEYPSCSVIAYSISMVTCKFELK